MFKQKDKFMLYKVFLPQFQLECTLISMIIKAAAVYTNIHSSDAHFNISGKV